MAKYTFRADTPMGLRVVTVTDAQINKRGKQSRSRKLRDDYRRGVMVEPFEIARAYLTESKGSKSQNPGPSAIPARWTPATVSRKGGQIQIRMGGR